MSIELIANAGLSLLQTAQYKAQINSSNMANARTSGYSVKSVTQSSIVSNGATIGVDTSKLSGAIDMQLQKRLDEALSKFQFKNTLAKNLKELTGFFGKLNDSSSTLSAKVSAFESSLVVLKNQPNKQENALLAVRALESMIDKIKNISQNVQGQRSRISQNIETTVSKINLALKDIHIINEEIAILNSQGLATADLEDKRREALKNLSSLMDVTYFINGDNKAIVSTGKGDLLVSSQVKEVSYSSPASLSRTAKYPGGVPGIMVDGQDITPDIKKSKLGALIQLRDNDLVKKQEELDEFATQFKNRLNQAASKGIPFPLQQTISGSTNLLSATPLKLSGKSEIIVTGNDGKVKSVHNLNLSSITTVGGLISNINSFGTVNASLNADGKLIIQAKSSADRLIVNPSSSMTTTNPKKNFSQILGINSLVTGNDASDIGVNKNLSTDPMKFPRGRGILKTGVSVGKIAISAGDSSNVEDFISSIKLNSFDAAGSMTAASMSFTEYSTKMLSKLASQSSASQSEASVAQKVASGISQDIASKSGVNIDEEVAKLAANQKAFQVAGHIIKTTQTMFDTLLHMSR